jgi:hypothetical protein
MGAPEFYILTAPVAGENLVKSDGAGSMPQVRFTQNLQRHLDVPECEVEAATVRGALDAVFQENPRLKGYVLDDQGRLRQHVVIFINGQQIEDRLQMSDAVRPESELFVMQALSGG